MVKIYCVNTKTSRNFPEGTTLLDMLPEFGFGDGSPILAAMVNNVCQGLKYRAFNSRQVEFIDYRTYEGRVFPAVQGGQGCIPAMQGCASETDFQRVFLCHRQRGLLSFDGR